MRRNYQLLRMEHFDIRGPVAWASSDGSQLLTHHLLNNLRQFRCCGHKSCSLDKSQLDLRQGGQIKCRTYLVNCCGNSMRGPDGDAEAKTQGTPDPGEAGRSERQSPWNRLTVQSMQRRLAKQAGMIKKHQWNPLPVLIHEFFRSKPRHRQ